MLFILRFFIAAVFLFSGISKLIHFELAELFVAESGFFSLNTVSIVAKLLVSFEIGLGFLILLNPLQNNKIHLITILVLLLFTLYLLWQMLFDHQKDCGCFPGFVTMPPWIAMVRNLILVLFALILLKKDQPGIYKFKPSFKATIPLLVLITALPFIVLGNESPIANLKPGKKIPLEIMDGHPKNSFHNFNYNLKEGKYIVAFVSLTCPNCKLSTKRLRILKDIYPTLPVVLVVNGKREFLKQFFEFTGAENMHQIHFNGGEDYVKMSGFDLPNVMIIKNRTLVRQLDYTELNETVLGEYFELK